MCALAESGTMSAAATVRAARLRDTERMGLPMLPQSTTFCACGCETPITPDSRGRPRRFINGHNGRLPRTPPSPGMEWRPVPGFPDLEASSTGQIRRYGGLKNPTVAPIGYLIVSHYPAGTLYVHRLVAAAFHGEPHEGQRVNHKNGNKMDNRPDNLEWCTPGENLRHAWATGLRVSLPTSAFADTEHAR